VEGRTEKDAYLDEDFLFELESVQQYITPTEFLKFEFTYDDPEGFPYTITSFEVLSYPDTCDNGTPDLGEDCQATDKNCESCLCKVGFKFDVLNGCVSSCGDGVLDLGEECEINRVPGCDACKCSIGYSPRGTLDCADVRGDASFCGNGVLNKGEECDSGENCNNWCACEDGFEPTYPMSTDCRSLSVNYAHVNPSSAFVTSTVPNVAKVFDGLAAVDSASWLSEDPSPPAASVFIGKLFRVSVNIFRVVLRLHPLLEFDLLPFRVEFYNEREEVFYIHHVQDDSVYFGPGKYIIDFPTPVPATGFKIQKDWTTELSFLEVEAYTEDFIANEPVPPKVPGWTNVLSIPSFGNQEALDHVTELKLAVTYSFGIMLPGGDDDKKRSVTGTASPAPFASNCNGEYILGGEHKLGGPSTVTISSLPSGSSDHHESYNFARIRGTVVLQGSRSHYYPVTISVDNTVQTRVFYDDQVMKSAPTSACSYSTGSYTADIEVPFVLFSTFALREDALNVKFTGFILPFGDVDTTKGGFATTAAFAVKDIFIDTFVSACLLIGYDPEFTTCTDLASDSSKITCVDTHYTSWISQTLTQANYNEFVECKPLCDVVESLDSKAICTTTPTGSFTYCPQDTFTLTDGLVTQENLAFYVPCKPLSEYYAIGHPETFVFFLQQRYCAALNIIRLQTQFPWTTVQEMDCLTDPLELNGMGLRTFYNPAWDPVDKMEFAISYDLDGTSHGVLNGEQFCNAAHTLDIDKIVTRSGSVPMHQKGTTVLNAKHYWEAPDVADNILVRVFWECDATGCTRTLTVQNKAKEAITDLNVQLSFNWDITPFRGKEEMDFGTSGAVGTDGLISFAGAWQVTDDIVEGTIPNFKIKPFVEGPSDDPISDCYPLPNTNYEWQYREFPGESEPPVCNGGCSVQVHLADELQPGEFASIQTHLKVFNDSRFADAYKKANSPFFYCMGAHKADPSLFGTLAFGEKAVIASFTDAPFINCPDLPAGAPCVLPGSCQCGPEAEGCDPVDGTCSCPDGRWGQFCENECTCDSDNSVCDKATGKCVCNAGNCGKNCERDCNCAASGWCDPNTCECLCQNGYHGVTCSRAFGEKCRTSGSETSVRTPK